MKLKTTIEFFEDTQAHIREMECSDANEAFILNSLSEGYFAEAIEALKKAEKHRWHDLRKDPKDLPTTWEDGKFYECVHENHIYDGYYPSYQYDEELGFGKILNQYDASTLDYKGSKFYTIEEMKHEKIIAWREIEPFEED